MSNEAVGRVLGTDEATPLEFWVAVAPGHHLQLDDVVALDRILPTGEKVSIYGIVGQVRARHEGVRFGSRHSSGVALVPAHRARGAGPTDGTRSGSPC